MELVQTAITIILFFVILGALVVIHEIGHFVTARLAGVRVLEFGIGFPPRARVLRAEGETLYTLNWLPIGGFVKLEGEDGDDTDDPRSFVNARLPVKLIILVSGVVMNVVLAFAIFTSVAIVGEPTVGIRFAAVEPGSPAAGAGLQPGDVIASVNGRRYNPFDGEAPLILSDLRLLAGREASLEVIRPDGSVDEIRVLLRRRAEIDEGHGALGIIAPFTAAPTGASEQYDPIAAIGHGYERTTQSFGLILDGLRQLGESIITRPTEPPPASGPIGIAVGIGVTFWQLGPVATLFLAGLLSANLAVVNILPFPPLDGGRMLVIALKRIAGERISVRAERLTYVVGFFVLFAFLIWITGFDLIRELGGGGR